MVEGEHFFKPMKSKKKNPKKRIHGSSALCFSPNRCGILPTNPVFGRRRIQTKKVHYCLVILTLHSGVVPPTVIIARVILSYHSCYTNFEAPLLHFQHTKPHARVFPLGLVSIVETRLLETRATRV